MLGQSVFNVALLKGVFTTTSRFQTISFESDAVTVQTVDNTKKTPMVVPKKIINRMYLVIDDNIKAVYSNQTLARRSVLLKTLANGYRTEDDDWMIEDFFEYLDAVDAIAPSEEKNSVVEMCTTETKYKHSSDILSMEEIEDWLDSDFDFTSHDLETEFIKDNTAPTPTPIYSFVDDVTNMMDITPPPPKAKKRPVKLAVVKYKRA